LFLFFSNQFYGARMTRRDFLPGYGSVFPVATTPTDSSLFNIVKPVGIEGAVSLEASSPMVEKIVGDRTDPIIICVDDHRLQQRFQPVLGDLVCWNLCGIQLGRFPPSFDIPMRCGVPSSHRYSTAFTAAMICSTPGSDSFSKFAA